MMKIKVNKEMTLPQLIEWAWENDVKDKYFVGNGIGEVEFTPIGFFKTHILVAHDDLFEVEVEEEILEETVIPRLLEVYKSTYGELHSNITCNRTINKCLELNDNLEIETLAIYKLNDDMTMTLIWKDGKLVE